MKRIFFIFAAFLLFGACRAGAEISSDVPRQSLFSTLEKSRASYEALQGYSSYFDKQEAVSGVLGEREEIYLKFEKPFKIYMGWLNTHKKGLQLVYERGRHDGKLAIHQPGLFLGLVPVIFLDQNSPWVKEGSASYNIEDAGIGTFLRDYSAAVEKAARENKLKTASLGSMAQNQITGEGFETTFLDSTENSGYFAYRIRVIFDRNNFLPVYMELYDWNEKPMGIYAYKNVKLDSGLDGEFKAQADGQLFKIYAHQERADEPGSAKKRKSNPKTNFH